MLLVHCEHITVGAINEGPNVSISGRAATVRSGGQTSVRLSCPTSLREPPRCQGTLKLQLATRSSLGHTVPGTSYNLLPGQSRAVGVRLSSRDQRSLRKRHRANGVVRSVETGQHGKKTTVKTLELTGGTS